MRALIALMAVLAGMMIPVKGFGSEKLGTVSFPVSCAAVQQAAFNRGVALLHDFWYEEAERQFSEIVKADPKCAMAHWGLAMSVYHEIWNRPDEATLERGWSELEKARRLKPKQGRERDYIVALSQFYKPGKRDYMVRVDAYSTAMAKLYGEYPDDVDAGAFYALSLLADTAPNDTSLGQEHKALVVLNPLFVKYPDHPGLAHYIIHACDTPSLASQGLDAAQRYGAIAPSGAHAAHMPGHIFARLGMWPEDIKANRDSVAASQKDIEEHHGMGFDQLHADDFLLYAYLQSGQDAQAKALLDSTGELLKHLSMPSMTHSGMPMMFSGYATKFPVFYNLERRDWKAAAALEPVAGAPPEIETLTYWARSIADGHLKNGEATKQDLRKYDALVDEIKKGKHPYYADGTGAAIEHGIVQAWTAYAQGNSEKALGLMRDAANLQDKVGQGEVDIPAREMLADMLLELQRPKDALLEYDRALALSPNRFNGLYHAGVAAEAAGDKTKAARYYSALLKVTGNGAQSERSEIAQAKTFVASSAMGSR